MAFKNVSCTFFLLSCFNGITFNYTFFCSDLIAFHGHLPSLNYMTFVVGFET